MLRSICAAASALFPIVFAASTALAGSSTDGIVIYSPLDGVTVVTVSTDLEEGSADDAPAVNVFNQVNVVNVVVTRRFFSSRCGIGVPYPSDRVYCGDPLYPLW